ncbi:MAG: glycerol-3-phosphate 1-O-acyltransferase PlsY [Candidatus Aminicenantaceae bacterium]
MTILFLVFAYLLGSVPSGYLLYRIKEKKDIRDLGSTNIGATNVLRLTGWKLALPVALIDILKGAIPVYLALRWFPDSWVAYAAGVLAVIGHCYPVYIRFKGGKGVATAVGVYAVLAPLPLLCSIAVFVLVVALTRFMSLGSLVAFFSLPFFIWIFLGDIEIVALGTATFVLIALRHRANIARLFGSTEKRLGEKAE